ncbi:flavin reductase family protein [Desulfosoma caldarium]|uniref:flavin reductase family protein n=1 Tax=Desulfosoma caldarium TaxID=610254 RepID=UPI001473794D
MSGKDVNNFRAAGLTPVAGRKTVAPLVAECPAGVECRLWNTHDGGNDWILVEEVVAAECIDGHCGPSGIGSFWRYITCEARRAQWPDSRPRSKGCRMGGRWWKSRSEESAVPGLHEDDLRPSRGNETARRGRRPRKREHRAVLGSVDTNSRSQL